MLNFVIFSKNRACQLDLLLRSLDQNNLNQIFEINVLYTFTEDHKTSYDFCKMDHKNVKFNKEYNFEKQTKELFSSSKFICLLTDDTVFFREFCLPFQIKENECFSWRLGYNTIIQDCYNNIFQPFLVPKTYSGNIISWNPNEYPAHFNYGYPFSFDGHVYNSKTLMDILKDKTFKNTNEIEGILHSNRNRIDTLISNVHSSCVNIPCNNISGLTEFGKSYYYSMDFLKNMYVSGKRIKPIQEKKQPVLACHQEFEFNFYDKG